MNRVNRRVAQQVVETVKDVCGYDINFIDESGIIFASTDEDRMGNYHEVGHKVAQSGTTIEVADNAAFEGTNKGVNIPIYQHGEFLAVIGISGDPKDVRKYAVLAEKITRLIVREQELNESNRTKSERRSYIINSLINNNVVNHEYLLDSIREMKIPESTKKRIIYIKINDKYNVSNITMIERKVIEMFSHLNINLYMYSYPREYIGVVESDIFNRNKYVVDKFVETHNKILKIGIGKETDLFELSDSFESAKTAVRSLLYYDSGSIAVFDDLTLEMILAHVPNRSRQEYIDKILGKLTCEDLELLSMYFQTNQSLNDTSEKLFIHKNTLQYRLDRIYNRCGFNPRHFEDAVVLYMACIISKSDCDTR